MNSEKPMSERDARRIRAGLSLAALAREAGVSVDTVRSVMRGREGQATKVHAIDKALDAALGGEGVVPDAPAGVHPPLHAEDGLIEFEVGGNFGVSVVVRGPVADREALEDSVLKLIQGMNSGAVNRPVSVEGSA